MSVDLVSKRSLSAAGGQMLLGCRSELETTDAASLKRQHLLARPGADVSTDFFQSLYGQSVGRARYRKTSQFGPLWLRKAF